MNVPKELLRSMPRPVDPTGLGRFVHALSLLLVVGAFVAGSLLWMQAERSEELATVRVKEAVTTTGVIQEARRRKDNWRMTYSFETAGKPWIGGSSGRKIEPGTTVEVGYLPSDPKENWIVGREPKPTPFWLAPVLGLALLLTGVLVQWKLRRERFLLENGRGAVALAKTSKRVHRGKERRYATEFEYRLPSGALARGRLETRRVIPVDGEFLIVYNPDQPKRVAKYPMPLFRIAE